MDPLRLLVEITKYPGDYQEIITFFSRTGKTRLFRFIFIGEKKRCRYLLTSRGIIEEEDWLYT